MDTQRPQHPDHNPDSVRPLASTTEEATAKLHLDNPDRDLPEESDTTGKKGQLSEGALPRARTSSPEDLADVAVNEAEPMPADDHPGEVD